MLKQPAPTLHKTTRTEMTPLFGNAKLVLDETPKAISPFGGLASFISFLGQIGFAREVQQHLPFAAPASNNAIPLAHSLTAFLMAVVVGARGGPVFAGGPRVVAGRNVAAHGAGRQRVSLTGSSSTSWRNEVCRMWWWRA